MTLSIVICTFNREEVLCQTVRQVLALVRRRNDVELIIVDQTRQHTAETERCLAKLSDVIQWHRVEFASLTRARNYGVRLAVGEIILFLDDDVEPSPELIAEHLACYADAKVWGVAGGTLLLGQTRALRQHLTAVQIAELESGKNTRFDVDFSYDVVWAPGCNMSFRRNSILTVGGFDERFYGAAVGEEVEFCHRIRKAGGRIRFVPEAALVHLVNPGGGCRNESGLAARIVAASDNAIYLYSRLQVPLLKRLSATFMLYRETALIRKQFSITTFFRRSFWFCSGLVKGLRRAKLPPQLLQKI